MSQQPPSTPDNNTGSDDNWRSADSEASQSEQSSGSGQPQQPPTPQRGAEQRNTEDEPSKSPSSHPWQELGIDPEGADSAGAAPAQPYKTPKHPAADEDPLEDPLEEAPQQGPPRQPDDYQLSEMERRLHSGQNEPAETVSGYSSGRYAADENQPPPAQPGKARQTAAEPARKAAARRGRAAGGKGRKPLGPTAPERPPFWRYLLSREFLFTFLSLLVLGVGLLLGFFYLLLPAITYHGETITVPEVEQLPYERATQVLQQQGLRVMVIDSQYALNLPPLTVLRQEPDDSALVKPGRRVYLTLNQRVAPTVRLPSLEGKRKSEAEYLLKSWRLKPGKITYTSGPQQDMVKYALHQGDRLEGGDPVEVGSRVDLVVTAGLGDKRVAVPELVGLPLQQARERLKSLGLSIGEVRYNKPPTEDSDTSLSLEPGMVYRQIPGALQGDSVQQGYEFFLLVYGDEPDQGDAEELDVDWEDE